MSNNDPNAAASVQGEVPFPEADLIASVNSALVEVHSRRLARLGPEGSGLFSHYTALLETGRVIRPAEAEASRVVRQVLPAYCAYIVLRAGLGEFAFLLAAAGLPVIACEPNTARCEALEAGLVHLVGLGLVDRPLVQVVPEFIPKRSEPRPALAIAIDFVFDLPLEDDEAFCHGLRHLDGLLLDPRLFIRLRETTAERAAATTFLRSLGFEQARELSQTELAYFVRPAQLRLAALVGQRASSAMAPALGFDDIVQQALALAPPMPKLPQGTTWVERRVRRFDLRSALGDDA